MSHLKKNIIANYASQIYLATIGIVALPIYIKMLGAESYGVVAFFAMLQSAFAMLDLGLTPAVSRQTSVYIAGKTTALEYSKIYRALSMAFLIIAFVGSAGLYLLSEGISTDWLNLNELDPIEVTAAIEVMAILIGLRWMTGLFRGVLTGNECFVWLSTFNVAIATLRFVIIIPVMIILEATIDVFFQYQLIIAVIEFLFLLYKSRMLLPELKEDEEHIGWSFSPLRSIAGFALNISFTSVLWLMVINLDKLLMSKLLSLENYGYFSLVVLLANGILLVSSPISTVVLPRLVVKAQEEAFEQMASYYIGMTKLTLFIIAPIAIILAFFSKDILVVWTYGTIMSGNEAELLFYYAIGFLFLVIASIPYRLQYAFGDLKIHTLTSILFLLLFSLGLYFLTDIFGMLGAGYSWFLVNLINMVLVVHYCHRKFISKQLRGWFFKSVFPLLLLPLSLVALLKMFFHLYAFTPHIELFIVGAFFLSVYGFLFKRRNYFG